MNKSPNQALLEPIAEKALEKFWKKYGRTLFVKARHTDLTVQPKMLVDGEVNSEVMRRIIEAYLAKITPERLMHEVEFIGDTLIIKDNRGKQLVEVTSRRLIDGMLNVVTHRLGMLLSRTERALKETYLSAKEGGRYSFGEIKDAVKAYLTDQGKEIRKIFLIEALILLEKQHQAPKVAFVPQVN